VFINPAFQTMPDTAQRIIPVIDLMGGRVVRGIAGQRERYQPLRSHLTKDARPASLAKALVDAFGFRIGYVADLDAIAGGEPDWVSYQELGDAGLALLIDAGTGTVQRARGFRQRAEAIAPLDGIIVGLESVASSQQLAELAMVLGEPSAVFSLDLRSGVPLADVSSWPGAEPMDIANVVVSSGFRRLIVLDLASVGMERGPSVIDLCRDIRLRDAEIQLISGGGVRTPRDARALLHAGCDCVLVASALHSGGITPGDVVDLASS
jgi:phosphoribosylformimino-5-aminoimidazole carboxamide ribotide isomerase